MKKKTSKIVLVVLALIMGLALASCGKSDSQFVGEWKATAVKVGDNEVSLKDYEKQAGSKMEIIIEIKDNGKATATTNGSSDGNAEWTEKDGTITLKDSTTEMKGKIVEDRLELEYSGMKIVLEKQK